MPSLTGRRADKAGGDDDSRRLRARAVWGAAPVAGPAGAALAALGVAEASAGEAVTGTLLGNISVGTAEVIQFAMFAGVMGAALLSAIWLIRERARTAAQNLALRARVAELGAALQRSDALLNLRDQRVVSWTNGADKPDLVGTLPPGTGAPEERGAFFAFGRWMVPQSAAALERAIAQLREEALGFDIVVETQSGSPLEVQGRRSAAFTIVRFLSLTETERRFARLRLEHQRLLAQHEAVLGLVDALAMPAWLRAPDGRLQWVNTAFAKSVDARDSAAALESGREFLGTQARDAISSHHADKPVYEDSLSTVVGGDRKVFRVTSFAGEGGSAGIALDVSEADAIRADFESMVRSHADTLDQLTTAVAIFDADQKLRFFNQAFQKLWSLDTGFLDSAPDNTLLLDRLRSEGKLAEQPEWRRWKENLLASYRALEPKDHWWHLPDGRTLRVIANPQPRGGVTWIFENLTEKIDLESKYNTAVRVQGETLDNLAEGVAVFGPDGRIRLSNPAFATLWNLEPQQAAAGTHIGAIRKLCEGRAAESPWGEFVAAATGFDDERRDRHGQTELVDGSVLRYAILPLPNGQVMFTFVDVTDSVNVERALTDKNEALEKADRIKNDFLQHVSYELRSPLTNIIGFTDLLALGGTGPLTPKQREYVDHIGSSSSVLLTIVNDILDLATVDAGVMELDIAEVEIAHAVNAAAELVSERFKEHGIDLSIDLDAAPVSFHADENRLRQILFNLLSNAANYAPANSTVDLECKAMADGVEFRVHDNGPGISPEVLDTIFKRFEPRSNGGRRRGAGLGLSIVKSFVELHGGSVELISNKDSGTTVICRFPLSPEGVRAAAE